MTTAEKFKRLTVKDLGQLAKRRGVDGWHTMRKDQLVRALTRLQRQKAGRNANTKTRTARASSQKTKSSRTTARKAASRRAATPAPKKKSPHVQRRLREAKVASTRMKDLSHKHAAGHGNGQVKDRLIVMVRDAYWLHAYWELSRHGVERAQAALNEQWHAARPVLRLLDVSGPAISRATETVIRHIEIHGGVNNWYVDVQDPPKSYRLDIGYLAPDGKYFMLARSNVVTTPRAGSIDDIDQNWSDVAENFEKIYSLSGGYSADASSGELQELFEERLRRPMGSSLFSRYTAGANGRGGDADRGGFRFDVDAELIVYGTTNPDAQVTLQGDPVQLRPDGTFTVRFGLPNCRQVIPAVACSRDGVEQRTIVLAIERNTKVMEPLIRDAHE